MVKMKKEELHEHQVPFGSITLWWLGQASFLCKSPAGALIAIDPYLTNACKALGDSVGYNMDRLVPPPLSPTDLVDIDLYAMTHSHPDHLDPETLEGYRSAGGQGPYVAPGETCEKLTESGVPEDQQILVWPNKTHQVKDVTLRATFAIPPSGDDLTHLGYLLSVENGPSVYFTGDTGYHEIIATAVADHHPDIFIPVINGTIRNLTPAEAAEMARIIDPKLVIPSHYDLFPSNLTPPVLLETNLRLHGLADRFHLLEQGKAFTYTKEQALPG
jgi:L-ascorbate 6-phosphate lactonase